MSLIDRINNAKESGVIVNVLVDAKKYLEVNPKDSITILTAIARSALSFSHLLSYTELKFLTDLYACSERNMVEWKIEVFVALSDALGSIEKDRNIGESISPLIDLISRYTKSGSISTVLTSSIHFVNEETHSRLLEYVSLLSNLPDLLISISLGSKSAHECSRRVGDAVGKGVKDALNKAFKRLDDGGEGHNDLRIISSMITKGRHMRVNEDNNLIINIIQFLKTRSRSALWDEISQAIVVRGECCVLEQEQIVGAVIEGCSDVIDYKRFFGHWFTPCKTIERACTVKYVVQRPLEKKKTRALIEYVDWASGMDRLKEISLKLIRILSTRLGVSAPEKDAIHRTRVLVECGRRMKERNAEETASFWSQHYPMVMQATRLSIENTDRRIRELGLVVAEVVSLWMDKENSLQFDYSDERKELIEEMIRRARGEEEEEEEEEVQLEETTEKKEGDAIEVKERKIVREMDSDDTDDELYEELEKNRIKREMISSDYEGAKVHVSPCYLREALEWIATEKEKYDKFEAGLNAIEILFRKRAVGWNEMGVNSLRTLIHLEDRFQTPAFENTVLRSMVAIVVGQPVQLAPFLAESIFERNIAVKQRYLITSVLVNAAKELAGGSVEKMVNPYKEHHRTKARTSKCEESQPDWVRLVSERVRAKTRRFSIRPASEASTEKKNTVENQFASVADRFILPLLKSKVGEHLELTGRDIQLLIRILYTASELLTLAEHSPSITRIALSLTGAVESLRYHEETAVREVVLAAYFAAATVLPEETLAGECKPWLQFSVSRINDAEEGERTKQLAEETTRIILMRLRLDQQVELD